MIRLKCLACGLMIAYRESQGDLCPRCLARGQAVQLLPTSDLPASGPRPSIGRLSINTRSEGERHTLFLKGEIDVGSAEILEGTIADLCAVGAKEIVLDLCGVEFIDSSGLGAILHGKALCQRHECAYSLTPAQRPVERMFDITGVKGRLSYRPGHARERSAHPPDRSALSRSA